ncbi:MAG: cyclopropane-fatty-acyl-phospholipid synthase family protein [Phycisphaerae bacterium]
MNDWLEQIEFERTGPFRKAVARAIVNPLANYLPASLLRAILKLTKSRLAEANWRDPGGWRSMVISYDGHSGKPVDRILIGAGAMPRALRNRRKLASRLLARLIDASARQPPHVLCLGAGPGCIIADALTASTAKATATLVDLSSDAFDYGRELATKLGLADRVRFVVGDARDVRKMLDGQVDVVKMLGLCEYLTDEQIKAIATAVAEVMPAGAPLVVNTLSKAHGTDRFFRRVFGLHMTYRDAAALQAICAAAGFGDFAAYWEPQRVYQVMVARRK